MSKENITTRVIADSVSPTGERLTTFIVTFPRIVLAEFNTHRVFSRNSASSRAIKFEKMIGAITETPFIPIAWQKDHSGMQGTEYFTDPADIEFLTKKWLEARDAMAKISTELSEFGLTKQLCNRLLESFMYHTVIVTSSEWENYFALRAHGAAEIHIADLAEKMLVQYNESKPKFLKEGEWHIPFGDSIDFEQLKTIIAKDRGVDPIFVTEHSQGIDKYKIKIAVARCARVSYTVVGEEGKPDNYLNDIKLHDRLSDMGHWSPFEHCARVMSPNEKTDWRQYYIENDIRKTAFGVCGNFRGFIQYRKTFIGENKIDVRVNK